MAKDWEKQLDTAKSYLDKIAKWMKNFMDYERLSTGYRVDDIVMVKFNRR